MNNQQYIVRPTLTDLNIDDFKCYPFIVSTNRCDLFDRMYTPNKMADVNLELSNMFKRMNESKPLSKYISCEWRGEFDCKEYIQRQKKKKKHRVFGEYYF